jgi:hypothetical protein
MTDARERNRKDFPTAAAWLDALRARFGSGCRLEYAQEGGREIGKRVVVPEFEKWR